MAVRVDEAGQDPARHGGDVVVAGRRGIRHPPADDPGLRPDVVGADEDGTGEVQHLGHGPTLAVSASAATARTTRRSVSVTTSGASECTQWPTPLTVTSRVRGNSARIARPSSSRT